MDREEFFRLKKVQGKKKREAAAELTKEGMPPSDAQVSVVEEPVVPWDDDLQGDLVHAEKDKDVIF